MFRRYNSFTEAGIDLADWKVSNQAEVAKLMKEYKEKFVRLLTPSFRVPAMVRATTGHYLNTDEAMEGIAECFRRPNLSRRAPFRIGINLSRTSSATKVVAVRGAAILALVQLCKSRGQATEIEVAYGNGEYASKPKCHVRIAVQSPNEASLTAICCSEEGIRSVGGKIIANRIGRENGRRYAKYNGKCGSIGHMWQGNYRFHEFSWEQKGKHEYDFVLDRIETSDAKEEYERVLAQLKRYGVVR